MARKGKKRGKRGKKVCFYAKVKGRKTKKRVCFAVKGGKRKRRAARRGHANGLNGLGNGFSGGLVGMFPSFVPPPSVQRSRPCETTKFRCVLQQVE